MMTVVNRKLCFYQGDEEFIGRALVKPVVKLSSEPYKKPLFPPILQWFPVFRGETRAGEILGAFEMLQVILLYSWLPLI